MTVNTASGIPPPLPPTHPVCPGFEAVKISPKEVLPNYTAIVHAVLGATEQLPPRGEGAELLQAKIREFVVKRTVCGGGGESPVTPAGRASLASGFPHSSEPLAGSIARTKFPS